jgi:hypothetical protein
LKVSHVGQVANLRRIANPPSGAVNEAWQGGNVLSNTLKSPRAFVDHSHMKTAGMILTAVLAWWKLLAPAARVLELADELEQG